MCRFVTECLDINKLTAEEKRCLQEYLANRKDEVQQQINDVQAKITRIPELTELQERYNKVDAALQKVR
jgi:hypothetical protein